MVDQDIMLNIKLSHDDSINQIKTNKSSTIEDLKYNIQKKLNFKIENQILIFKGDILENKKEINYYNIKENNVIILVIEENENEDILIDKNNIAKNTNNNSINQNKKYTIPSNNNLQNNEINIFENKEKRIQKPFINPKNQNNNSKSPINNSKNGIVKKIKEDKNSSSSESLLHIFNIMGKSMKNVFSHPEQIIQGNFIPFLQPLMDDDPEVKEIFSSPEKIKEITKSKEYRKFANIINAISKTLNIFDETNDKNKKENNNNKNNNEDEDYHNINYHKMNNNIKKRYENKLRQLNEMGFDNQLCIQLLNKYNGDINKCMEELLKY